MISTVALRSNTSFITIFHMTHIISKLKKKQRIFDLLKD